MAQTRYRYISCHPVTRGQLHSSLRLIDPQWSQVVGGNGTLSAKVTVPEDPRQVDKIKIATTPKQSAIYVRNNSGQYVWGGFVVGRKWNSDTNQVTITCIEWRGWPYFIVFGSTTGTNQIAYTATDQLAIARNLMTLAIAEPGSPPMTMDATQTSGKLRDLSFWGTELRKVGSSIDTVANRDSGFEWTIESRAGSDGLPFLHLATSFPQRGSLLNNLLFKYTPGGSNIIPGEVDEDYSGQLDRFYATGSGQPPAQPVGYDTGPGLTTGSVLRFDGGTNFGNVVDVATLTSHARRSRKFYEPGTNFLTFDTDLDRIPVDSYQVGDRGRLQWQDRWMTLDLPAVRIVEKKVNMAGAGKVTVTVDLVDATLPEIDAGGSV